MNFFFLDRPPTKRLAPSLLLIVAAGALLRLFALERSSLWLDEYTSIEVASRSLGEIVLGAGFDRATPPLYYVILHFWLSFFGTGETALRIASALFDTGNIVLMFFLFRALFTPRAGILASLLYALSPFAVYYAQEGRMYTLTLLLVLLTVYLALQLRDAGAKPRHAILLLLFAAAGLYTHYYFTFVIVALSLGLIFPTIPPKRAIITYVIVMVVAGLLFLPWLGVVLQLAGSGGQTFRPFRLTALPYLIFRFAAGYAIMPLNAGARENLEETARIHIGSIAAYSSIYIVALALGIRRVLTNYRAHAPLMLSLSFIPVVIAAIVSLKLPLFSERYLTVVYPFMLGFVAVSGESGKLGKSIFCGFMAASLIALFAYYLNDDFGKEQWRDVAALIHEQPSSTSVVLVSPSFAQGILRYYLKTSRQILGWNSKSSAAESALKTAPEFWLVERGGTSGERPPSLEELATEVDVRFPFENGIRVRLLRRPSTASGIPAS